MTTLAPTKPAPLGDATNLQKPTVVDATMQEKVTRTHIWFDDEGNVADRIDIPVEQPNEKSVTEEVEVQDGEEAHDGEETEDVEEFHDAPEGESEGEEKADEDKAAKMAYRNVPSFFNTEKERTAKWDGKHRRFSDDDEGEDDGPDAPVSEEMLSKIDDLSSAVSTSMVVDAK